MAQNNSNPVGAISLPKGGGAIKGIGETFQPNLFTGTGNFSIPIATSPGRTEFGPKLSLQYSTGQGNGFFGLGWQLSIPRISRKTEKGIPQYKNDTEDVFVMSSAEDLVPYPSASPRTNASGFTITCYRPRTEGLFARIEKWQSDTDKDIHWRATTRDNVTSIYGRTPYARVFDPAEPTHVFEWLLQETFDAKGNHILYEYATEVPPSSAQDHIYEQNRNYCQRYPRRIFYGNPNSQTIGPNRFGTNHNNPLDLILRCYLFEVVFDYGDDPKGSPDTVQGVPPPTPETTDSWPLRPDPFSNYRAGFEIRTLRRCERVLMYHHFPDLDNVGGEVGLVKSTGFTYIQNNDTLVSFLASAKVTCYRKEGAVSASLPPVSFQYSEFTPHEQHYQSVFARGDDMPPQPLSSLGYTMLDLFGDGLPGILHSSSAGFRYWRNLGKGQLDRPRLMHTAAPAGITLETAGVGFADFGGDGLPDLMVSAGPLRGFYEMGGNETWTSFRHIDTFPSLDLSDPNLRQLDLTGDGLTDLLITLDHHFLFYKSLGENGYANPKEIERKHGLDEFPDVYFADPSGRVRLADMTGDGLSDIVLVHEGRVDYWPNLGYGRFGKRITMGAVTDAAGLSYGFDPQRLFLADLDGSGCADLVYVEFDRVHFWFNQSGNAWSKRQTIPGTPPVNDPRNMRFVDFFGTGTTALVWSYDYAFQPGGNYKVLDFCGGIKPYLLTGMSNNMGATTRVSYAASTRYALEDRAIGEPWATKLPFPVQVLEKVEVIDHIGKTKLVTTYKYHHGYFDGAEREFRGFGRVDRYDSEDFKSFSVAGLHTEIDTFTNGEQSYYASPVLTRSWFHTGAYLEEGTLDQRYRVEYYAGDPEAFAPEKHIIEATDSPREAHRTLRGQLLRSEVYALDDPNKQHLPYTVTENRYRVRQLQAGTGTTVKPVFLTTLEESLSYHYEREPANPRIGHQITLQVDDFGNITDSVAIGYPRRVPVFTEQSETKVLYTHTDFINRVDQADGYYVGVPCQKRSYEITGVAWARHQSRLDAALFDAFLDLGLGPSACRPYHWQRPNGWTGLEKRIVEWTRSYFRSDSAANELDIEPTRIPVRLLDHRLALGEIAPLALSYESYQAAFTDDLRGTVYCYATGGPALTDTVMPAEDGYHQEPDVAGHWWIPSGQQKFNPGKFYLSEASRDSFGNDTRVTYDAYDLLMVEICDPLGNRVTAGERDAAGNIDPNKLGNDYRVLQPRLITDPNGNVTQAAFDTLGLVVGTALMGKGEGDDLAGFQSDLPPNVINDHLDDPFTDPLDILKNATTRIVYDLNRYYRIKQGLGDVEHDQPNVVYTLARETHAHAPGGSGSKVQHGFLYSDGFGREIQKKIQAEPGSIPKRDADDKIIVGADGQPEMTALNASSRWVGSGWTIYNNKGKPARQFEPFFTDRHGFEFDVRIGVSSILCYDPLERVVATLHPNHSYEKVVFDPWRQESWDVNDTIHPTFRWDPLHKELLPDPTFDPADDPDVGAFFKRLPHSAYLPTWSGLRRDPTQAMARWPDFDDAGQPIPGNAWKRKAELESAEKAARHAATPTVAHFDTLGRPFLTIADNGKDITTGADQFFSIGVELDIEGNTLSITDARNIQAFKHRFDIAGRKISIDSVDAGLRLVFPDVSGNPRYTWDANQNRTRTEYDGLLRPTEVWVRPNAGSEFLAQKMIYGESILAPAFPINHLGKVWKIYDGAGLVINDAYDFKGNLQIATRRLLLDAKSQVKWSATGASAFIESDAQTLLEAGNGYKSQTEYDALNRVTQNTTPDGSISYPVYNEANLLNSVSVAIRGGAAQPYVSNIDYDAKGQRSKIVYGNQLETNYEYEADTYRLSRLTTITGSPTGTETRQALNYSYDPAGNITQIRDDAIRTIWYDQMMIEPESRYSYDPTYRLILAGGREHIALGYNYSREQTAFMQSQYIPLPPPTTDAQALQMYTETYQYDAGGNLERLTHYRGVSTDPVTPVSVQTLWVRNQFCETDGTLPKSNRITFSRPSNDLPTPTSALDFEHDANGNMLKIDGTLHNLQWDFKNQLVEAELDTAGNKAYYQYDAGGQRVRKFIVKNGGGLTEEHLYFGGTEIYRKTNGSGTQLERHTVHVMDDKKRIARVETEDPCGSSPTTRPRYQLDNHLGSSVMEVDDSVDANIISYEEYYPYGETSFIGGKDQQEVSARRYRYSGKERDEETGLYYYGARYYAPWLGRWVSADPAGVVGGLNLYIRARCNPAVDVDRNGLVDESTTPRVTQTPPDVPATNATAQSPRVLSLGRVQLPLGEITGDATDTNLIPMTEQNGARAQMLTGLDPVHSVREMRGFREVFDSLDSAPRASATLVQEAMEGGQGILAIHMNIQGVDVLRNSHSSAELRSLICGINSGGSKVPILLEHGGGVSMFAPGNTSTYFGAALPDDLARHLPAMSRETFVTMAPVTAEAETLALGALSVGGALSIGTRALSFLDLFKILLTDDPRRVGQFQGEPLLKTHAAAEQQQLEQWYLKSAGYESQADMDLDYAKQLGCTDCSHFSPNEHGVQPSEYADSFRVQQFLSQYLLAHPAPAPGIYAR